MPTGTRAATVFKECGCPAPAQVNRATMNALAAAAAQKASAKNPNRPGKGSGF